MRVLLMLCLAPSACFAPNVSKSPDDGETETDGDPTTGSETLDTAAATTATTPESASSSDASSGETETSTEGTTSTDLPPVVESFTVNGSTMPAEVEEGGSASFEVVAIDDIAVARVEFFRGNESLGVVEEEPYVLELPLTSIDSGIHGYRAVVTDTAEQVDHSETVNLSVNIEGGEVDFLREHLFVGADVFGVSNGGLSYASPNRIYLGARTEDVSGHIAAYDLNLSLIWARSVPEDVDNAPVARGDELISPRGNRAELRFDYHRIDPDNGATIEVVEFESGTNNDADFNVNSSFVLPTDSGYVLRASMASVELFDETLLKQSSVFGGTVVPNSIDSLNAGGFVAVVEGGCAGEHPSCVRKYQESGDVEWSVGVDALERVAPNGEGGVFAIGLPEVDDEPRGYTITELDERATTTQIAYEYPAENIRIFDAVADGQGGLVLAGSVDGYTGGRAFVVRYDSNLDEVWRREDVVAGADSMALALVVADASVYVYGLEDLQPLFLGASGDAWVARMSL